jgi:thiol-disulfide isomerase/thioredoxin
MAAEKKENKEKKTKSEKKVKKSKTVKNTKILSSDKKNIFGKVFANWCGACKALKPKWLEMVNKLNGINAVISEKQLQADEPKKTFIINKDGTILEIMQIPDTDYESYKNTRPELSGLEASGFPTIFRKIHDSPIEYYDGDREPDAMIQWAMGESRKPIVITGGNKIKKLHNKTQKNHKKSCGACNSGFSQSISKFWGWK